MCMFLCYVIVCLLTCLLMLWGCCCCCCCFVGMCVHFFYGHVLCSDLGWGGGGWGCFSKQWLSLQGFWPLPWYLIGVCFRCVSYFRLFIPFYIHNFLLAKSLSSSRLSCHNTVQFCCSVSNLLLALASDVFNIVCDSIMSETLDKWNIGVQVIYFHLSAKMKPTDKYVSDGWTIFSGSFCWHHLEFCVVKGGW